MAKVMPGLEGWETDEYGYVESCYSVLSALKIVDGEVGRGDDYIWRGQSNLNWGIHSGIYRTFSKRSKKNAEKLESRIQSREQKLLQMATHQGYRYEGGRELTDFELLAKLQHHGAATRLTDFTTNLLVALWFACSENNDKPGLVFGLNRSFVGGLRKTGEARPYNKVMSELSQNANPSLWEPPVVSGRVVAQSSVFVFGVHRNTKFGTIGVEESRDAYIAIGVDPSCKESILDELSEFFNINQLTLFPDIDGFCRTHGVSSGTMPYNFL